MRSRRPNTRFLHAAPDCFRVAAWLPAALVAAALLIPTLAHSRTDRTKRSGQTAAVPQAGTGERYTIHGSRVAVYNLAGAMVLEPESGDETVVEVNRAGADAGQLKVTPGHAEGREDLRVVYPGSRIVYPVMGWGSNSSTRVRDDGTFGGDSHSHLWPEGRTVHIAGSGGGLEAHADLRVRVPKGGDVLIRLAVGDVRVTNVDSKLFVDIGSGAVVTSDTRGDLGIDTGSGSVRVARASGPLKIDTGSGGVAVRDVRGGPLSIDTGSGGVEATTIDVPSLYVDTGSGHVELSGVSAAAVHVDTGSGRVRLGLTSDVEDLNIGTGSGGVDVELPNDAGAMLALEAGSGPLDVDMPMSGVRRDHGELSGKIGDGKGRIVIETGSGGIHLSRR